MTGSLHPKLDLVLAAIGGGIGGVINNVQGNFLFAYNFDFGHVVEYTTNVCIGGVITLGFKVFYDRFLVGKKGEPK